MGPKTLLIKLRALDIEPKIYVVISFIGICLCLFGAFINSAAGLDSSMSLYCVAGATIISLLLYGAIRYDRYQLYTQIVLGLLSVFLYPSIWMSSGGSCGPALFLYIFNFMIIGIVLSSANFWPSVLLNLCMVTLLFFLEIRMPGLVEGYSTEASRYTDFGLFFLIISGATFLLAFTVMRAYNKKLSELQNIHEELVTLSTTDALSGLHNRHYIMEALEDRFENLHHSELSLIMIDIDNFKKINDRYGHSVGDDVIERIGRILNGKTRRTDLTGRIGGEEFMVVLNGTGESDAVHVAEELRKTVEDMVWERIDGPVTISCGVYTLDREDCMATALERVDVKLYAAKHLGRNKVCW